MANACKLVNPYLAFTVIKAIAPQQSWFIADYGMHCFITNVNSSEYFLHGSTIKLEKTTDMNYKPLVIDFINYPLDLGLTYLDSKAPFEFHDNIKSFLRR